MKPKCQEFVERRGWRRTNVKGLTKNKTKEVERVTKEDGILVVKDDGFYAFETDTRCRKDLSIWIPADDGDIQLRDRNNEKIAEGCVSSDKLEELKPRIVAEEL